MQASAIVPAAGSGSRIQKRLSTHLPKPYLMLGAMPILARTLISLQDVPEIREIIVACHPKYRKSVLNIRSKYAIHKLKRVVRGGKTRTDSVYQALKCVSRRIPYVLVHDGVRPFISSHTVHKFLHEVGRKQSHASVLGRPVVPTVKEVKRGAIVRTLERVHLWEIETPQVFKKRLFEQAYRAYYRKPFQATDDASLVEALGERVSVFPIREHNMKVTTLEDLQTAQKLFENHEVRTGWGEDTHRLERGRPLYLGGVKVPSLWGARGHSDGDVILHAIVDALLGALGLGDIGVYFSDKSEKFRDAQSKIFLRKALDLIQQHHFEVVNIDTTVILERPKLGLVKKKIQRNIARLACLDSNCVGIKAKTAEGLGPEGRSEAISCHAVVTLRRKF